MRTPSVASARGRSHTRPPFIRPERLKCRIPLPILRWMSIVDRLMPELAGAGPRTRAAVTVAAVAMPAALAGEVALTASGRAAGSGALAYAIVMAVGFVSMMTVLALRAAMPSSD